MLEIKDLNVVYGSVPVLQNITFSLRPGELTALVGRNGSGKSTLLSCVNQRLKYTGTIELDGKELSLLPPRERAKRIAIAPQSLPWPHITAREVAAFGRNPYLDFTGRLTREDREKVEAALERCGVLRLGERYADTLSGGEKQRLALAMILAQEAEIMLLDEPTAHMDQASGTGFLKLLKQQQATLGRTCLVILHDLSQAVRYADNLMVLDGGKLVFSGTRQQCLQEGILEKTFHLRRFTVTDGEEARIFFSAD